jgi:hypothetical protein
MRTKPIVFSWSTSTKCHGVDSASRDVNFRYPYHLNIEGYSRTNSVFVVPPIKTFSPVSLIFAPRYVQFRTHPGRGAARRPIPGDALSEEPFSSAAIWDIRTRATRPLAEKAGHAGLKLSRASEPSNHDHL